MSVRHQKYRRAVQTGVLVLLLAVPLLNLVKFHALQGTLCSLGTKDFEVTCGLGAIQSMLANREVYLPLAASALFFVLLAMLGGRVFCSWVCPQHAVSETADKARRSFLGKAGGDVPDSPARYKKGRAFLLSFLGAGLLATFITGVPVICYICPVGIICKQMISGTFLYKLGGEAVIIGAIAAADVFVARRGWCRYICPLGAFYSLFTNRFSLKIKRNAPICAQCGTCREACPMGDAPMQDLVRKTCTNCAVCIDSCPHGALEFAPCMRAAGKKAGKHER